MTPGLSAYLCYVLASMNLGFSWIYEWMEKTYRQIILAPDGLQSARLWLKSFTVTVEASVVLWIALCVTAPIVGFTLGNNFLGLVATTSLSVFSFTCIGLGGSVPAQDDSHLHYVRVIAGVALMFASGIIVPVEAMPGWEQIVARALPMYYWQTHSKALCSEYQPTMLKILPFC